MELLEFGQDNVLPNLKEIVCGSSKTKYIGLPMTLWKGHMVGTNGSIDKQEVTFQNMCTWLPLPK